MTVCRCAVGSRASSMIGSGTSRRSRAFPNLRSWYARCWWRAMLLSEITRPATGSGSNYSVSWTHNSRMHGSDRYRVSASSRSEGRPMADFGLMVCVSQCGAGPSLLPRSRSVDAHGPAQPAVSGQGGTTEATGRENLDAIRRRCATSQSGLQAVFGPLVLRPATERLRGSRDGFPPAALVGFRDKKNDRSEGQARGGRVSFSNITIPVNHRASQAVVFCSIGRCQEEKRRRP